MRSQVILFLMFIGLLAGNIQAQTSRFKKAESLFEAMAFNEAIPLYKPIADGDDGLEASLRLAECYRLTNQISKAEPDYAKAVERPDIRPEFVLYYAQSLQVNGKCTDAVDWYRRYNYMQPNDPRGLDLMSSCTDISDLLGTGSDYELLPLTINSAANEMCPFFFRNGLVYSSSRPLDGHGETDQWTGEPYYHLFFAEGEKDRFSKSTPFAEDLISSLNDGPASFSGTGNTMYFSRNNAKGGKGQQGSHGGRSMQIYKSVLVEGGWSKPEKLSFCDPRFEYTHPAISADGSQLIFSSNCPGGQGGMDIWLVEYGNNVWGTPANISSLINTPGNEVFPFIHDDGTLYFASDGRRGLGGLDIYRASLRSGSYTKAENMRSPINSPQDDFGLVFDPDLEQGYFSSNRPGGKGGDDVYSLTRFPLFVEGILLDKGTMEPLGEARIILYKDGVQTQQVRSDPDGRFVLRISSFDSYSVTAFKEGYNAVEKSFETGNSNPDRMVLPLEKLIDPSRALTLELKVIEKQSKKPLSGAQLYLQTENSGTGRPLETDLNGSVSVVIDKAESYVISADKVSYFNLSERISSESMSGKQRLTRIFELESYQIGKPIRFRDVQYEHAQTELNMTAKLELDQLARLMLTNPSMMVQIGSHTDANGRNQTNDRVSRLRAEEVVNYLVSQGVDRERLTSVGYGESKLLNYCSDGIQCPEELHRENRRTEWTIIQY